MKMTRSAHPLIEQCLQFANSPVDDHEWRARSAVSDAELSALAVRSPDLWDLYYRVVIAQNADRLYRDNKVEGSIAKIRKVLSRVETRKYESNGETIVEEVRYHYYPVKKVIRRDRIGPNGAFHEVELAFQQWPGQDPIDLDRYTPGLEEESILLCQRFRDSEAVQAMAFLPEENRHYRVILSSVNVNSRKLRQRVFIFPIALRYDKLLKGFAKRYRLEGSKEVVPVEGSEEGPSFREIRGNLTTEMQEGRWGLWITVQTCELDRVESIEGFFKKQVGWHMGEAFKRTSTASHPELWQGKDGKPKRIRKDKFDRLGGSLDAPMNPLDPDSEPFIENLEVPNTIESSEIRPPDISPEEYADPKILLDQICSHLPDKRDRDLLHLLGSGFPQTEIAQRLGLNQSTISRKIEKLRKKLRPLLQSLNIPIPD